jgi:MATE family multidrug resistance protein
MVPLIYAYTLGIIIDAVAAYVFIYKLNYGILAAPWIIVATYAFEAFFMLLFIYKSNKEVIRKCRHFPRRSDFNFFCTTLKDSIMTSLMVVIEFSGAQLNLIMSSYLSEAMTSAFTTMFLVEVLAWIVGFSLSNVVALKVGKHLGTKKTHKVSKFGRRAFTFALAGAILYMVPMIVLKNRLGSFFFTDPEVVKIVGEIVPYIILAAVLDILQVTLGNILRVFGWFTRAIVTSLVGFYVVGVPLSILLAFYFNLQDQGLFLSYSCALFIQSVVYITFVSTIRVEDEIERIAKNYKTIPQTDSPYVPLSAHSSYTEHKELADS